MKKKKVRATLNDRSTMKLLTRSSGTEEPRCGLCGKTTNLIKTPCCGNWICDDAEQYRAFSYARNSCYVNHSRHTLCGYHFNEGHKGDWKTCKHCKKSIETEMYVYYGTNEYNFTVLENPPKFKPTHCSVCGKVIRLSEGGYSLDGDDYLCEECSFADFDLPDDGTKSGD
jgi:hypothetical protein